MAQKETTQKEATEEKIKLQKLQMTKANTASTMIKLKLRNLDDKSKVTSKEPKKNNIG